MIIRGIIQSVAQGIIQRFSASGRFGETIANREFFQQYGYTSRPKEGAELIIIAEGNCYFAIASDDRRYRIALEEGEMALYDDQGQKIHLKRDKEIEISGCDTLTATVGASATITVPHVTIVASTQITMTTPLLTVSGNVEIGGTLAAAGITSVGGSGGIVAHGNVADVTGTMAAIRSTYNGHTHPENGNGGGTTSQPNQEM